MFKNPLISIYDFSIFPYALGDIVTWCEKQNCKAIEKNKDSIFFIFISDVKKINKYQKEINLNKLRNQLLQDLLSIPNFLEISNRVFLVNNYDEAYHKTIYLRKKYQIRVDLGNYRFIKIKNYIYLFISSIKISILKNLKKFEFIYKYIKKEYRLKIIFIIRKIYNFLSFFDQKTFNDEISSHEQINNFYFKNQFIPKFFIKQKITDNIITVQLRLRKFDKALSNAALNRDSSLVEWSLLFKLLNQYFSEKKIFILGRLEDKPSFLFKHFNINSVRDKKNKKGLKEEITILLKSVFLIATSSGFSSIANFSNINYIITKINSTARKNYQISSRAKNLPFALKNQILLRNESGLEIFSYLLKYFNKEIDIYKIAKLIYEPNLLNLKFSHNYCDELQPIIDDLKLIKSKNTLKDLVYKSYFIFGEKICSKDFIILINKSHK